MLDTKPLVSIQNLRVEFQTRETAATETELVIPETAIQRLGERTVVFLAEENEPGHFKVREVETGGESGGFRRILNGLKAGERIVTEGDEGQSYYAMISGKASVRAGQPPVEIASLSSGSGFGEMSLLTGEPRAATVVAVDDCVLLELDREALFADGVRPDTLLPLGPHHAAIVTEIEIRQAVEAIWPGTKVVKVNTLNRKGKAKRQRRSARTTKLPDRKHAIVTLTDDSDEIEIFQAG